MINGPLKIMALLAVLLASLTLHAAPDVRILAIADIQYADKDAHGTRFYRSGIKKLEQIRIETQREPLDFLIHLGDLVDGGHRNVQAPLSELERFPLKKYYVMGNHDFADTEENVEKTRKALGLKSPSYYFFDRGNWRFVAADSNTLGAYFKPKQEPLKSEAAAAMKAAIDAKASYAKSWNGGIDKAQFAWLRSLLERSETEGKRVVIFAHTPARPLGPHIAINTEEIVSFLAKHPCVKAYINGHNHRGGYEEVGGVHYLTVSGLVETADIASYAILELYPDRIEVLGHGNTPTRRLALKP
jgi:3',5'-cyclic AMP phosphodiesterase CpdA